MARGTNSPLFIGKMIRLDPQTKKDLDASYVAIYLDGSKRPNGGPSCAQTLDDLIAQLKLVGKARRPFEFEPPKGVFGRGGKYGHQRYEALEMHDFWRARTLLGLDR